MSPQPENIHPIFDQILSRSQKEELLGQRGAVIWLTGLSGSGKSTIARGLESELHKMKHITMLLDGDNVRTGINSNLGFTNADREENIRRIAEVSKLFLNCGIITLNSFVSPTRSMRGMAREIIGDDFIEVYVNCPLHVCENRDVKGLYKKARAGEIKNFTGIDDPFEAPENPDLEIQTENQTATQSVAQLLEFIKPKIQYIP